MKDNKCKTCAGNIWICPDCRKMNNDGNPSCWWCGRPKPQPKPLIQDSR